MNNEGERHRYSGGCLCGAARYVVSGPKPRAMFLCHCRRCRKETGSAHGANAFFEGAELTWERGADNLANFHLEGTRKRRAFCKTCGSPLPRQEGARVVLPVGSLDDGPTLEPTAHIFCDSRAAWEAKLAGLPRFDGMPKT